MTMQLEEKVQETRTTVSSSNEVINIIKRAIEKVGGRKENDLCRYIPMSTGGYMHHFTLKKMKKKQPQELAKLVDQFVLQPTKPVVVASKQRAARGSRKKRDVITFTKPVLERLLQLAKGAGDKEVISMLRPTKSLATLKRELIQSVRQNRTDADLWSAYCDAAIQQAPAPIVNPFQD